ncbi:DNA photolyase, FAD-binding/Cryptochrome [Catenaria anguillulae PL171]|uniref:DNA photolyase, FAD-binding/Cryptochrome n=1 Tax=Catenaria anguillulae PL171 TaxID=765915 RepID=A0A1Y2HTM7_9FUNG|nr:DNA photolyase, FAD-binding/Cryptochrome [Catenaria anguillulae PL171]
MPKAAASSSKKGNKRSHADITDESTDEQPNTMSPASHSRPASAAIAAAASAATKHARRSGPVVFWFRKDLRLRDNKGLYKAWVQAAHVNRTATTGGGDPMNGALLGIFVVCGRQWHHHDLSPAKVDLMLRSVQSLQERMESPQLNIPLTILHARNIKHVPQVVKEYLAKVKATHLYFNVEYEVDEGKRDDTVAELVQQAPLNVTCVPTHDECVVPPGLVKTKDGTRTPVVYTPFRKSWESLVKSKQPYDYLALSPAPEPNPMAVRTCKLGAGLFGTRVPDPTADGVDATAELPGFEREFVPSVLEHTRANYLGTEDAAHARLVAFAHNKIKSYSVDRDFPNLDGTANISAYLALGLISARQCITIAREANNGLLDSGDKGCVHWIQEIVWREFYRHILVAFPRVCMNQPFKLDTLNVPWTSGDEEEAYFTLGARARRLKTTGFMSNRLRMITAMFLTKDLLVDWRKGEKYFMQHLVDGDLASNNGGWQWAASTGTDSQPYFRIFNPWLQSVKFDPRGDFIRKYVPELRPITKAASVHEPHTKLTTSEFMRLGYVQPIVDHKKARDRVLKAFKVDPDQAH